MPASQTKALTWRITDIPEGTSHQEVIKFFEPKDQDGITVCSLCPDVYGSDSLTATVLFRPHREKPDLEPKLSFHKPPDMEIDKTFEGFTPLYCPQKGTHIAADIIAITGLAGHAFGSWAHSEEKMWLRDYLPKSYARNARVLTYGYSSHITGDDTSMATLGDLSNSFSDNLINMRDSTKCDQRPIIFIGHSLGCMLIKKSMTSVRMRNVDSSRLPVRALIFLAAPHRGMNIDVLRSVVKNEPPKHLIEELSPDSPTLKDLNESFMDISRDINILTCFETQKTKTLVWDASANVYTRSGEAILMLPQSSATGYWPKEIVVHANANHSNIAKLKKGGGSILLSVGMAIKRALVPTARNFFTDTENTGDTGWKDQKTTRPDSGSMEQPGALKIPGLPMYTDQSHSDLPSPQSGLPPLTLVRHSTYPPMNGSMMIDPEMSGPSGPPYASGSSQSPHSAPWNPTIVQNYAYAAAQDSETRRPVSQNTGTEPAHFAQSGGLGSRDTQSQYSLASPPPYNHSRPSGQFTASQSPGENGLQPCQFTNGLAYKPQQSDANNGPGMQVIHFDRTMRQRVEQMGLSPDVKTQIPRPTMEHERTAADSPSHGPGNPAAEMHPAVYYDRSDDESESGDERVGVAECAYCHADVVSGDRFFQCSKCASLELACQKCQKSPVCMNHGDLVQLREFIWYGGQLASNIYISDEPQPHDSPLVQALKTKDMGKLDVLARAPQLVNKYDLGGRTPLHIAVHLRLHDCAKLLLMCGANPEFRDRNFCTPLSQAILSKNADMAILLLERGANPDSLDNRGNTPLHLVSIAGCFNLAQVFVKIRRAQVDRRNNAGETALFRACQVGNFDVARVLLNAGADANTTNDRGATQLGELAALDERQAVTFLLHTGAKPDSRDGLSRTALYRAAEHGNFGPCNDLMQHRANPNIRVNRGFSTPLGEAASNGHVKTVEALIEGGANIEGRDVKNRTPLFRAAADQQLEVCHALLERRASPNPGLAIPDDEECQWGMTPLQIAAFFDLDDVAEVLIKYRVRLEETDQGGRTALFWAAERGNVEVTKVLLSAGADFEAEAGDHSVVSMAAQRGHFEIVQLLLRKGAEPVPPLSVNGQKWKNFVFDTAVMQGRKKDILELLRSWKHR